MFSRIHFVNRTRQDIGIRPADLVQDATTVGAFLLSIYRSSTTANPSRASHVTESREIVQGTLDLLVLASLVSEPMHGWGIAQRIRERSGSVVLVTTGALYPALHRLERRELIHAEWRASENNRRAKYYALTDAGRRALRSEAAWWQRFVGGVAGVLSPT